MITLSDIEARVIGCLSEKEATTPDYYPLTLNSLTLACNQKSNRNPVVDYDEEEVAQAIESLREKKMVMRVDVAGSRVAKFSHRIEEHFNLSKGQRALLTVLLLRGAQTLGELKTRTERMNKFSELLDVERALTEINEAHAHIGVIIKVLPPQLGQKEKRYVQLLSDAAESAEPVIQESPTSEPEVVQSVAVDLSYDSGLEERVSELELEIEELKEQFAEFKKQFE